MYSLIATDTKNHFITPQYVIDGLLDNRVAELDEDGDVIITDLRAATAYCQMIAFDLALDIVDHLVDDIPMQVHAQAGALIANAADRGAKVLAIRVS